MNSIQALVGQAMLRLRGAREEHRAEETVFRSFYAGRYGEAIDLFQQRPLHYWSDEDRHLVFASMAILGTLDEHSAGMLPDPLTEDAFQEELARQVALEQQDSTRGLLKQPRHLHKTLLVAALARASDKRYFVETGTYTGQSLLKVASLFDFLWSVEASPELFRAAQALFEAKGIHNVELRHGNSSSLLRAIEPAVAGEAIFFLDAHFSHGITSREFGTCPVLEELDIILSKSADALIVIDDLRTMSGLNGYPSLETLLNALPSTQRVHVAFDQLIVNSADDMQWLDRLVSR